MRAAARREAELHSSSQAQPAEDSQTKTVATSRPQRRNGNASPAKVRAELNLEKWPAIWQPSKSKNQKALRVFEREVVSADGSKVVSRVEVGYTHLGTLTTEDQRMYYALIHLWEDSGKPSDRPVFFSDRLLARVLKKSWGTNVRDSIVKSLRKLRTIPIEWINSYYQKTEEGKTVLRERTPFTILSELKIVERETDGAVNAAVGYFKSDDRILHNLLANYTKPLFLETILNLKSDIAQLLYVHVDLMLARKDNYQRRTKDLFQDLGLRNPEYNRQYERYRALRKAVAELQGARISTGILRVAAVEKTLDGLDYKIVFRKMTAPADVRAAVDSNSIGEVVIHHYAKLKEPVTEQADELVKHFHRIVHGVEHHEAQSKERGQALSLLAQHGFERTLFIIRYAADRAKETSFDIQHFGAILSYASRAIADFEQRQKDKAIRGGDSRAAAPQQRVRKFLPIGESRLAALTTEQYQARFQKAKAELMKQVPFLSQHPQRKSSLQEHLIRAHIVRALETESMALVPVNLLSSWLPRPERGGDGPQNLLL
jgi:hypothetical protein